MNYNFSGTGRLARNFTDFEDSSKKCNFHFSRTLPNLISHCEKNPSTVVSELAEQQVAFLSQVKRLRNLHRWLAMLLIALGAS